MQSGLCFWTSPFCICGRAVRALDPSLMPWDLNSDSWQASDARSTLSWSLRTLKLGGTLRKLDTTSRKGVWTATRVGKMRYSLCQEFLTGLGSTWPLAEAEFPNQHQMTMYCAFPRDRRSPAPDGSEMLGGRVQDVTAPGSFPATTSLGPAPSSQELRDFLSLWHKAGEGEEDPTQKETP